jgi:hypothetical protein
MLIRTSAKSEYRLMNVENEIWISLNRSPGFCRVRLARQDAAAPAGIPPAKAGTPEWHIWTIFFKRHLWYQACPAGCRGPGRHPTG